MSSEILAYHQEDNRYLYCLDHLYEKLGKKYEYHIIERESLVDVQIYEYFFDEFQNELNKIMSVMEEKDTLIINVSSGTPAMKSALLVVATLNMYNCMAVQVTTPDKRMNDRNRVDRPIEELWKLDVENNGCIDNRCHEVSCPSLTLLKLRLW